VMHPDKDTPVSGPQDDGWELSTVLRITMNDPDGGDMTLVTLPVRVALHQPHGGTIDLKTDTNRMLADLDLAPLPGCTQIEFLSVSIQDPDGAPFAVLGAGTR